MKHLFKRYRALPLLLALALGLSIAGLTAPRASAASEVTVSSSNFAQVKQSSSSKPVLVVVSTSWCQYCKVLDPMLKKLAQQDSGNTWTLAHVDGDTQKDVQQQLGVNAYPTIIAFSGGKEMTEPARSAGMPGGGSESDVADWISRMVRGGGGGGDIAPVVNPTVVPTNIPTVDTTDKPAPTPGGITTLPPLPTGAVQITSDAQFETDVIAESKKRTVILDFSKDGCEPCIALAPILDKRYLADNGKWQYARIDGTQLKEIWAKYNNPWFPSLIAIRDGKELGRQAGFAGDAAAIEKWITDAADGKAPATDPLVMTVKSDAEFQTAVQISDRHPVILRFYNTAAKDAEAQGKMAAEMANGDGGKWTLANIDASNDFGKKMLAAMGEKANAVDWAKHVILYQGTPRFEDELTAFGSADGTDAGKTALREWINKALSHHYKPSPTPSPAPTVDPTVNPTVNPTPPPAPVPPKPNPAPNPFPFDMGAFIRFIQQIAQVVSQIVGQFI